MIRALLIGIIQVYRYTVSPLLSLLGGPGSGCRFEPTCSLYCIEALRRHGPVAGGWLGLRRLCRCHPWGGAGFDPVPNQSARCCAAPLPHPGHQNSLEKWTGKLG